MPFRYTRKIRPDQLPKEELEAGCHALFSDLFAIMKSNLREEDGWQITDLNDSGAALAINGHFECQLSVILNRDLVNVRGQGMVPVDYIMLSATSKNAKRVSANSLEVEVTHSFQKTFSVIGCLVLGIAGLLVQVLILRRISIYLTIGLFFIGSLIGGLIGYMSGNFIGTGLSSRKGKMSFDEEVDVGVAKNDWERFIAAIGHPVDTFCAAAESQFSRPTIT